MSPASRAARAVGGFEGVAPGARFLLVKTDFINTDRAVSWVFRRAGGQPCVINMSLGHHFGAHDGTDQEERLHRHAGRPRQADRGGGRQRAHRRDPHRRPLLAGRHPDGALRRAAPAGEAAFAVLTLWYDRDDRFEVEVVTPFGQALPVPAAGNTDLYNTASLDLELSRRRYSWSRALQVQIALSFKGTLVPDRLLAGWQLRIVCQRALTGRLDGWVNNSGFARFQAHPLVETARTVGLPATGEGCLAVASYVSRADWQSDEGPQQDQRVLAGRSSPFSSRGPTRDGRRKPDLAAPGQYVTAALADLSGLAGWPERARVDDRLVTIEGTSMAAPVVAGALALALERSPRLSTSQLRDLLRRGATRDRHNGALDWTPEYGHGKLSVQAMIGALP